MTEHWASESRAKEQSSRRCGPEERRCGGNTVEHKSFLLIGLGIQHRRDERHDALSSSLRSHGLQDQQLLQREQPAQKQAMNHPAWTTRRGSVG